MGTYLREQAIEAIARNVLKAYDYALLRPNSGAVPILDIAIKLLKLEVEYQYIRNNGRILGETVFRDTMVPLYNEDEKQYELVFMPAGTVILDGSLLSKGCEGRLRYTLAHEIGHWVLHQPVYSSMTISTAAMSAEKSSEDDPALERQADMLAAALLMPLGSLKGAFYALRPRYAGDKLVAELARTFQVSQQAMSIRLRSHGLPCK